MAAATDEDSDRLFRLGAALASAATTSVETDAEALLVLHVAALTVSRAAGHPDERLVIALRQLIDLDPNGKAISRSPRRS